MIELTKQQFDTLLSNLRASVHSSSAIYGITESDFLKRCLILKYHFEIGQPNLVDNRYSGKDTLFVFKQDKFQFKDNPQIESVYDEDGETYGHGFTKDSNLQLWFTPDPAIFKSADGYCDCVVVYWVDLELDPQFIEYPFDFVMPNLKSIDYIGNGIHSITFNGSFPYLEEVNLSNNVDSLAFPYGESNINSDYASIYNGNFNPINFQKGAFAGSPIKKFVFPTTTISYAIPESCFEGCSDLLEVVIPDSVYSIGANAFKKCTNLRYVYIGSGVAEINDGAFEECICPDLTFDVSYSNNRYLGEYGALLGKLSDKTYFLIHATSGFFNADYTKWHYLLPSDWPNTYVYTGTYISVGMFRRTGGTDSVTDIHGNVQDGGVFINENNCALWRSRDGDYATQSYYLPIHYFIVNIEEKCCINDPNLTTVDFLHIGNSTNYTYLPSLYTIKASAFKGCINLATCGMPYPCNYGVTPQYNWWRKGTIFADTLEIMESAFEGCGITSLTFYKRTYFGNKAFYNCQNLTSINFTEAVPVISNLIFDSSTGVVTSAGPIGKLCFGKTPSLQTITSDLVNSIHYGSVICNAIISNGCVIVGCKGTNLKALNSDYGVYNILENAFYESRNFNFSSDNLDSLNGYGLIGRCAFYGCTSLASTISAPIQIKGRMTGSDILGYGNLIIGEQAFYGCTSFSYLYINEPVTANRSLEVTLCSKAFANSGVKNIFIGPSCSEVFLSGTTPNMFDGCVLESVRVDNHTNALNCLQYSNIDDSGSIIAHNSVLSLNGANGRSTLVKSGNESGIVNVYDYSSASSGVIVTSIKDNAFSGVNLNDSDNSGEIYIPTTVDTVGKSIFAGSKIGNSETGIPGTPYDLVLTGDVTSTPISGCLHNSSTNNSIGLLYYLGGRYFKKIVEDTLSLKQTGKHYYNVVVENNALMIKEGLSNTPIAYIGYDNDHNVVLTMYCALKWDYMANDTESHLVELANRITLYLMYNEQKFTTAEELVYCDSDTAPGTTWCGISIPNDITRSSHNKYFAAFNMLSDGAFSNCKWITNVQAGRIISGNEQFNGCTNLEYIIPQYYDNNLNYNVFNGIIGDNCFNGCQNFRGISSPQSGLLTQYPIIIGNNAFNNCSLFATQDILDYAVSIGDGAFNGTAYNSVNLISAHSISPTAFNGLSLSEARADSICGYYFTGEDGYSIVNGDNKVVVGTRNSDLNSVKGICDNAFTNMTGLGAYSITSKNDYTIGKNAFSNSDIVSYVETGCQRTVIGENAFKKCEYLTTISFNGNGVIINKGAFEGCNRLNNVTLPNNIDIPENAFKDCISLSSFSITGNIGANAFNGCITLSRLAFMHDVNVNPEIDPSAFIGCLLSNFTYTNHAFGNYIVDQYNLYKNDKLIDNSNELALKLVVGTEQFIIREDVKVIGKHAFNGRNLRNEIVIPGSVTKIEDYAFANNPNITKIFLPPTVEYIGEQAFAGCTRLNRVVIPDSCKYIGANAFKGCPLAEGLNCNTSDNRYYTPNSETNQTITGDSSVVPTINSSLDLTNLSCVSTIGDYAFSNGNHGCESQIVKLPKTCTSVGNSAFKYCTNLTELHITATVNNEIKPNAFYGCGKLGVIYIYNTLPTLNGAPSNTTHFYGVGDSVENKFLHVPASFENSASFLGSDIYSQLVNTNRFEVIYDL